MLPFRQALEFLNEILLQRIGRPGQKICAFLGQVRVNLTFVLGAAYPINQFPMLEAIQDGGYRRLAETDLFRNGADSHLAQIPNRSHDQQLGPREPGMLAEALRMKVRRPDNPPESHQYIFITVHSNTPIRSWEFLYTPNY